jgi:hypothetical protein
MQFCSVEGQKNPSPRSRRDTMLRLFIDLLLVIKPFLQSLNNKLPIPQSENEILKNYTARAYHQRKRVSIERIKEKKGQKESLLSK